MRQPLTSICRVTNECMMTRRRMAEMAVVIKVEGEAAQGLRTRARRRV